MLRPTELDEVAGALPSTISSRDAITSSTARNAASSSPPLWNRLPGSFLSARSTTAVTSMGMSGRRSARGVGCACWMRCAMEKTLLPVNGRAPVSSCTEQDAEGEHICSDVDVLAHELLG